MLTDEQLTDDLARAFRDETAHLTYTGRVPAPRRAPLAVLPALGVAAAAAAVIAVPVVVGHDGVDRPGRTGAAPSVAATSSADSSALATAPTTATGGHAPAMGEQISLDTLRGTLRLAGYGLVIWTPVRASADGLYAVVGVEVPGDATPLDLPGLSDVYAGADAQTGKPAVFVRLPTTGGGTRVFELTSPTMTTDDLAQLLRHENATPVPLVSR